MKRIIFIFIFILSMDICVFANPLSTDEFEDEITTISIQEFKDIVTMELSSDIFEIKSFELKNIESTFDLKRSFSGSALKNTEIIIRVFQVDEYDSDILVENELYETHVGASGIFSQIVNLNLGRNYIIVYINNDISEATVKTVINRKDIEIKQKLERGIALPGQSSQ